MKILRFFGLSVQIIKISSMYLNQVCGWNGAFLRAFFSKSPRKRLAKEGAILVPIAVPWI